MCITRHPLNNDAAVMLGFLFPSPAVADGQDRSGKPKGAGKPQVKGKRSADGGAKPRTGQRNKRAIRPAPPRPLTAPGLDAPLELRESARTRRYTLKVDAPRGLIQVVTPAGTPEAEALAFVARHADWVRARVARMPAAVPFADGVEIPVQGTPCRIRHETSHRGAPVLRDGGLIVGGDPAFLARRVRDWLIARARAELVARAHAHAAALGARPGGVTLRDTRSRWGSCSATGRLSFSWRLILAPPWVLNYVAAHEAAHLKEMNHSPRFWALCESLTPDAAAARAWLKSEGGRLFRYGAADPAAASGASPSGL